eukprot:g18124.t1
MRFRPDEECCVLSHNAKRICVTTIMVLLLYALLDYVLLGPDGFELRSICYERGGEIEVEPPATCHALHASCLQHPGPSGACGSCTAQRISCRVCYLHALNSTGDMDGYSCRPFLWALPAFWAYFMGGCLAMATLWALFCREAPPVRPSGLWLQPSVHEALLPTTLSMPLIKTSHDSRKMSLQVNHIEERLSSSAVSPVSSSRSAYKAPPWPDAGVELAVSFGHHRPPAGDSGPSPTVQELQQALTSEQRRRLHQLQEQRRLDRRQREHELMQEKLARLASAPSSPSDVEDSLDERETASPKGSWAVQVAMEGSEPDTPVATHSPDGQEGYRLSALRSARERTSSIEELLSEDKHEPKGASKHFNASSSSEAPDISSLARKQKKRRSTKTKVRESKYQLRSDRVGRSGHGWSSQLQGVRAGPSRQTVISEEDLVSYTCTWQTQ